MRKKVQNKLLYIDECVDKFTEDKLISEGYLIHSIRRYHSGMKDYDIDIMVREHDGILLTKDHDFDLCDYSVFYSGKRMKSNKYDEIIKKICE